MCTVVFATMMIALIVVPYIERKFIGRLMDRLGNTMSARSLWIGEGGVTAGEWWNCPFGLGAPIGMVNRALNKNFGNDKSLSQLPELETRGYHGIWFLLPGFVAAVADS